MQKKIIELGKPSYITVETEEKMQTSEFEGTGWTDGDVCVEVENGKISVKAEAAAVKTIRLRFPVPADRKSRILGSTWERTYGDTQWTGMSANAFMPWFFLTACEGTYRGYGVKEIGRAHV